MKVAILGNLGFKADDNFLRHLGVKSSESEAAGGEPKIGPGNKIIGYEAQPRPAPQGMPAWQAVEQRIDPHLSLSGPSEAPLVAVFSGDWGGVALHPM